MRLNYKQSKELTAIQTKNELNSKKSFWYREIFLKNLSESLDILKSEIKNLNNISNNSDDLSYTLSNRRSLLNKTKTVINSINNINNYIFIDSELRTKVSLNFEKIEDILGSQKKDYLSILSEINKFEVNLYNDLYFYEINEYKSK